MKHNNCYVYPPSMREVIEGKRHYAIKQEKLPSVTAILSATQDPEKVASLQNWRDRVGDAEATKIMNEAATRGTAMHKILERYIDESGYLDLTQVGQQAHNMAIRVIEQGLCNVSEYYGLESTLYYPGLYAGATDLVGVHKGEDAIIDFKQTNKPKREEWIGDYKLQLAAYAMAHNYMHKTEITKGVIMMCSKDNYYQEFIVEGQEFKEYTHKWLGKVSDYYEQRTNNERKIETVA
jgi:CRISPR/Cas system-associated exonuclease Cas4 (RecB family)